MNQLHNQSHLEERLNSQQQTLGEVRVEGNDNTLNVIQGRVVNLSIYNRIPHEMLEQLMVREGKQLTRQQYRQRQVLLNKVYDYWIKGVLEKSLYATVLIDLGLEERHTEVYRPFDCEEFLQETEHVCHGEANVTEVFNQMEEGRTLLILGEPGSGKTITLLNLARDLLIRAKNDSNKLIPIVFNLSSWANKRLPVNAWLLQELHEKYQVSKALGKEWIGNQQIILLLDGLDEVMPELRNECVQALNQFCHSYSLTEMVICCRIRDYQNLAQKLTLRRSVCIHPLTPQQINKYFDAAGDALRDLRIVIRKNSELQTLATNPLMLNIMSMTYQGCSLKQMAQIGKSKEVQRHLLNAYVDRMFRRRKPGQLYSREQTEKWLVWLAQQMVYTSQTIFYVEGLQPTWLPSRRLRSLYMVTFGLCGGASGVFIAAILFWLSGELERGLSHELFYVLSAGLIAGVIFGMARERKAEIKTVETFKWFWSDPKRGYRKGFFFGVGLALTFGSIALLSFCLSRSLVEGWGAVLLAVLTAVLINGLITELISWLRGPNIERKEVPNQGIYTSMRNAIVLGGIFGTTSGIICYFTGGSVHGLIFGFCIGLSAGLSGGGRACGRHLTLRSILYCNGHVPWNYSRFLDSAADCLFLQKVGGGYIFMHRLLLEHFSRAQK